MYMSFSVKIYRDDATFGDLISTERAYQRAVLFLFNVACEHWDERPESSGKPLKERSWLERLVHATKKNPFPAHDLSAITPHLPSYLRRAALAEAFGAAASWMAGDPTKKTGPSAFRTHPALYAKEMISPISFDGEGKASVRIKVAHNGNYRWETFRLNASSARRAVSLDDELRSPKLVICGKTAKLTFPRKQKLSLRAVPLEERKALGADLGVNAAAACSALRSDGTVASRRILRLKKEEGRLERSMGEVRRCAAQGLKHYPKVWARLVSANQDIAIKTADFILDEAVRTGSDVIVFEHLSPKGRIRGKSRRMRLHFWRARAVQSLVEAGAHRLGMRIAHVAAFNTSAYAFDGSSLLPDGTFRKVMRGVNGSYNMCRFPSGKIYDTDLSASYNIGARYFIREILLELAEEDAARARAEVPGLASGITRTLHTLTMLHEHLGASGAAAVS